MRYKALSATTVAVFLCGASAPSMAKGLDSNQIYSQYVRGCVSLADGSVRAYIPQWVRSDKPGPLAEPCNPATEMEVLFSLPAELTWNLQNSGGGGGTGPAGPAGPAGPQGPPGPPGPVG